MADKRVQAGDGITLHAHVAGALDSGRVLIGVHGGPGMDDYTASLDELAGPELAVVRYEQRGVGRSTPAPDGVYDLASYVHDLEAVRRAVAPLKVHVLGHSWGGLVAMAHAAAHGEHVESLILSATVPPTGDELSAGDVRFRRRLERLQRRGLVPDPLPLHSQPGFFDALLPVFFHDPGFAPPPDLQGVEVYPTVGDATWRAVTRSFDLTREAATITCPVLVLDGEGDPFGVEMGAAAAAALTSARVQRVTLEACGHFWHEQQRAFFAELRSFLEQVNAS